MVSVSRDNLRLRERKADRRAAGLCVDCGKGPLMGTRCEACTTKHRERQVIYQQNRPPRLRDPRTPHTWCGECLASNFHRLDCPTRSEP